MELYQLRSFVAVAEEGRLSGAAEKLNTSQPAVSAHVKNLEKELGLILFTRTPRGMVLTEAGRELELKAREALSSVDGLITQAKDLRLGLSGEARLGINTDANFLRVVKIGAALKEDHPNLGLRVLKTNSWRTPDSLRKGELDGGFVYGSPKPEGVEKVELAKVPLRIVAPPDWSNRIERASWEEAAAMPWIWFTEDCPFHEAGRQAFISKGLEVNIAYRTDDEETLLALVIAGKGLSMLREEEALQAVAQNCACVWPQPLAEMEVSYLFARSRRQDRIVQALLEAVQQTWA